MRSQERGEVRRLFAAGLQLAHPPQGPSAFLTESIDAAICGRMTLIGWVSDMGFRVECSIGVVAEVALRRFAHYPLPRLRERLAASVACQKFAEKVELCRAFLVTQFCCVTKLWAASAAMPS